MTVIVMTREMGTLGKDVASEVARRLSLEVVHQQLVDQRVAEQLDVSASSVHRLLEGQATLYERWKIDKTRLGRFTAVEVLELAGQGNVLIRGWGAAQLLRGIPHVIRVRVCAPMEMRVRVMMERIGSLSEAVARREIGASDSAHQKVIEHSFNEDFRAPENYDMVLNTGRLPIDSCADYVVALTQLPAFQATDASVARLQEALQAARVLATGAPGLNAAHEIAKISGDFGTIPLSPGTTHEEAIAEIEKRMRGLRAF